MCNIEKICLVGSTPSQKATVKLLQYFDWRFGDKIGKTIGIFLKLSHYVIKKKLSYHRLFNKNANVFSENW
jgi:hypothetical protein